jgi:hypothetical protein
MGSLRGRRIPLTPDGQLGSPSLAVFSFPSGAIPTWTRTASLIAEHAALRDACGGAPSHWALYRFTTKLRAQKPLLDACLGRVLLSLHEVEPPMGKELAIDATDLPPTRTGRGLYGFKLHAATCVKASRRHPLVPRGTKRFSELYSGRAAVEREFGRLKNEYGLAPPRVRGLEKVALHADLTMLARLSLALARARAVPLAA